MQEQDKGEFTRQAGSLEDVLLQAPHYLAILKIGLRTINALESAAGALDPQHLVKLIASLEAARRVQARENGNLRDTERSGKTEAPLQRLRRYRSVYQMRCMTQEAWLWRMPTGRMLSKQIYAGQIPSQLP